MGKSKYIFLALATLSLQSLGQSLDPSFLSQLTPEQISMVRDLYEEENAFNAEDVDIPIPEESLVDRQITENNNESTNKYGYDFFSSMPTSLTAIGDLPLPNDYKISLRDEFSIILSGSRDATFTLDVKLDGTILFPELGSILVVGLSFKEVRDKLANLIQQSYVGVNIDVSLRNLSAKKITIVGAVNTPGTYLVNPFSTISGALAYSGGISEIGSLREIKLIRTSGEVFSFDLYDLLIKGERKNDLTIEAGDTILINAASRFVEIEGSVNRPAIYEILEGENLNDLINFALGFTNAANRSNISISYLNLENASIDAKIVSNLEQDLNNALSVRVFSYLSNVNANIQVLGAVEEPGFYDLKKYKTLNDLIKDLNFIDVYPWLGVLEQFDDDNLVQSTILFNLNDINTFDSIELLPNSKLHFANLNNRLFEGVSPLAERLISDYSLTINYKNSNFNLPVFGKFSVKAFTDLLGLDLSDVNNEATYISPLESIVLVQDLSLMEFEAKKYHNVSLRSRVNDLITINIQGALEYPGNYVLKSNSTLEDLYSLVGKFRSDAFLDGIIFTRESVRSQQLRALEQAENAINEAVLMSSLQENENTSELSTYSSLFNSIQPANLGRIAGDFSPFSTNIETTTLFDGDSIIIPKKANVINVVGEVFNPIAISYSEQIDIEDAIQDAGGYKLSADKKRVYVIKANGFVIRANRNIFIGKNTLEAGDTIVVPKKIIRSTNPALQALTPLTQILSNLAFSAAAIDNLSNN